MSIKSGTYNRYSVNLQDSIKLTILGVGELIIFIYFFLNGKFCKSNRIESIPYLIIIKIKEWWGAKVTIDPQMETKKQKINEIDQYIKGLTQSFSNLSALFQCRL